MINEKNKKKIKIAVTCLIIALIIWFVILNPLLKFNNMEKKVLEAAERYYEISPKLLPTGEKISTVALQKLYEKDFISSDLKAPYSSKLCDSKASWVKVKKENGEYKYYVYLKCGVFSSNIDHDGPTINLKGEEEVTIYKGDKYKDAGIESVIDNTDGKIDIKKVTIDTSKVNTNKNGTYEVTYKIKDSFNNETIKIRKVNVIQTLNNIVKKATDKTNVYKGYHDDNYIKLDGILFKIIGINDDDTVKIISAESLAYINYDSADSWLNEYFYNKLSDSLKKYIVDSKWCNDEIKSPNSYKKCNSFSKKKPIGLISVVDVNNSKDSNNKTEIDKTIVNNTSSKKVWYVNGNEFHKETKTKNIDIKPAINLQKDITITNGDGSQVNPYILKEQKKNVVAGEKISEAKVGEYINYSGYNWRIIAKESDNTTKIIMDDVLKTDIDKYYLEFDTIKSRKYSPNVSSNIGYKIINNASKYVNTSYFVKKKIEIKTYQKEVGYGKKTGKKEYNLVLSIPSMYELFSNETDGVSSYWYVEYSSKNNQNYYKNYDGNLIATSTEYNDVKNAKVVGYLNEKVKVKSGSGNQTDPYKIVK